MTDLSTTNARVLHHTLAHIRELKELLGFKSLALTWDYVVAQALASAHTIELRAAKQRTAELLSQAHGN